LFSRAKYKCFFKKIVVCVLETLVKKSRKGAKTQSFFHYPFAPLRLSVIFIFLLSWQAAKFFSLSFCAFASLRDFYFFTFMASRKVFFIILLRLCVFA